MRLPPASKTLRVQSNKVKFVQESCYENEETKSGLANVIQYLEMSILDDFC